MRLLGVTVCLPCVRGEWFVARRNGEHTFVLIRELDVGSYAEIIVSRVALVRAIAEQALSEADPDGFPGGKGGVEMTLTNPDGTCWVVPLDAEGTGQTFSDYLRAVYRALKTCEELDVMYVKIQEIVFVTGESTGRERFVGYCSEGCGTMDSPNIEVFSTCQRCTCYSCGEPRHSDLFCRECR